MSLTRWAWIPGEGVKLRPWAAVHYSHVIARAGVRNRGAPACGMARDAPGVEIFHVSSIPADVTCERCRKRVDLRAVPR